MLNLPLQLDFSFSSPRGALGGAAGGIPGPGGLGAARPTHPLSMHP